jgi:Lon protease-like protein
MLNKTEHPLNENLPLFPLGIMVLPGETRFLHIFEQRYKNLFEDIKQFENCFCIPFVFDGKASHTGSLVILEKVLAKYPNGELDIAVKGIDIVEVRNFNEMHPNRLYPYGDVETLNKNSVSTTKELLKIFEKYNDVVLKLDLSKYSAVNFYLIANSIGLSDLEKYDLLLLENEKQMNKTLLNYVRLKTIIAQQKNALHKYYSLN